MQEKNLEISSATAVPADPTPHQAASYFVLVNTLITLFLLGAVLVISNNLMRIPVVAFIGLFGLLTLLMLGLTLQALGAKRLGWARTWNYWGCVFFGIATVSAAHRMGWLAFVPDLMLVWLLGFAVSALWLRHTVAFFVSELLLSIWMGCTFLYGQSYVPGLVICAVFGWHFLKRQPHAGLLLWNAVNALLLVALYLYDVLQAQHYPLHFPPALVLPLLAVLALLWSLSQMGVAADAVRQDFRLIGQAVSALAVLLLVLLSVAPLWKMLLGWLAGPASTAAILLAGLCWLLAIAALSGKVLPGQAPTLRSTWLTLAFWILGPFLLELTRTFASSAYAIHFSLLAASLAVVLALLRMRRGISKHRTQDALMGSLLLVVVVCAVVIPRDLPYWGPVLAMWLLASVLLWPVWKMAQQSVRPAVGVAPAPHKEQTA